MNENLTLKEIVINDQNYQILNVQLQNGVSYLRLQANTGKEERINMTYLIQNLYEQKVEEDMRLGRFQNLEDMRQKISNVHEYLKDHVMYQSLMRLDSNIRLDQSILNQSLQKLLKEYQQKKQENKVQMNGLSNQAFENQGNKEEVMVNDEVCKNTSYILKEEDTFSIRRHGKYKVVETEKTRRDKYVIHLKHYQ